MPLARTQPEYPVLGLPEGVKTGPRADFRTNEFLVAIETMGALLAWSRACACPCARLEGSTQPDMNCSLCHGRGLFYFGAPSAQDLTGYTLNSVQQHLISLDDAMVIRGLVIGQTTQPNPWDRLSRWMPGTAQLTVRPENKVGFYDRLVDLESQMAYSEDVLASGGASQVLRYPATAVNLVRSLAHVYEPDGDYQVGDAGELLWAPGRAPAAGEHLAVHYLCHPTWLVIEYPHVARVTTVKNKVVSPLTPVGDPRDLPLQALIRLDFLPDPETTSGGSAT